MGKSCICTYVNTSMKTHNIQLFDRNLTLFYYHYLLYYLLSFMITSAPSYLVFVDKKKSSEIYLIKKYVKSDLQYVTV